MVKASYHKKKMGIRNLSRFIQEKCSDSPPSRTHLRDFSGKRIAVDTSIYLYRYSGEGALLENMYLMASIFRHYNIHAVFVFDGPPPPQKTELIEKRKKKKDEAKREYDRLERILKENKSSTERYRPVINEEIEDRMRELKKKFVRLRDCDIATVKELLVSFGFATIDAEGEADVLCANLSIKRRVDACLSDDTDMFVYGCPVVLRGLSLLNHTVVSYNMREILKILNITQQEFKMMCVVCGIFYSSTSSVSTTSISDPNIVYKELIKYNTLNVKEKEKYHNSGGGFYDWYSDKHINNSVSAITFLANESMFDTTSTNTTEGGIGSGPYKQLIVLNRDNIQKKRIIEIMTTDDFIFVDSSPSDEHIIKSLSTGQTSLSPSQVYNDVIHIGTTGIEIGAGGSDSLARMIAKEVYDIRVEVSNFQELQDARKKSHVIPIKIKKKESI